MEFTIDTEFFTGSGAIITMSEAVKRIAVFIEDSDSFTIDVGTDSQTSDKSWRICCRNDHVIQLFKVLKPFIMRVLSYA